MLKHKSKNKQKINPDYSRSPMVTHTKQAHKSQQQNPTNYIAHIHHQMYIKIFGLVTKAVVDVCWPLPHRWCSRHENILLI